MEAYQTEPILINYCNKETLKQFYCRHRKSLKNGKIKKAIINTNTCTTAKTRPENKKIILLSILLMLGSSTHKA